MVFRVGLGYDVHSFCLGRPLILGGIEIPFEKGLSGHSDADVLVHSIIDSLFGASGLGDIGYHFPDTDYSFKNISSILLLEKSFKIISDNGWSINNIDSVVICQKPKILPYVESMKNRLSQVMGNLPIDCISIKGKTTETLGFTGRGEGIAVHSICMLTK